VGVAVCVAAARVTIKMKFSLPKWDNVASSEFKNEIHPKIKK
jgi:hypothetical protein